MLRYAKAVDVYVKVYTLHIAVSVYAHTTLSLALPSGCCTRAEILHTSPVCGLMTPYPFRLKAQVLYGIGIAKRFRKVGKSN